MQEDLLETTFALLRLSLDAESIDSFLNRIKEHPLSKEDWAAIYDFCKKQTIIGVVLVGVNKLPEDLRPPREILDHWICQGFYIHQQNIKMNAMCAKVTKMFADRGLRSVILKGQANARLYPDPFSRQCGDIDILVEGGKKNVIRHLKEMGLMEGAEVITHHVHLDAKFFDGISVEVHFRSITCMPIARGRRLLNFLKKEANSVNCTYNSAGFYEPSLKFALMMQLAHLRKHFMNFGIGLRQLIDYYLLLRVAPPRNMDTSEKELRKFGLLPMSKATMFVMKHVFLLNSDRFLSGISEKWGGKLVKMMLMGGNFGKYKEKNDIHYMKKWLVNRKRMMECLNFDFAESLFCEMNYWLMFAKDLPKRIKYRRLSLKDIKS